MNILALETSVIEFSVALVNKGILKGEYRARKNLRGSDLLLPNIQQLLTQHHQSFADLDAIAISQGPGSFTGLRIGFSVVKGFCLVKDLRVVAVPSLDVIAYNAITQPSIVCVLQDAYQGKVYACVYRITKTGKLRKKTAYLLISIDELLVQLQGDVSFLGDGLEKYKERIGKSPHIRARYLPKSLWRPKASVVGLLAYAQLSRDIYTKARNILPMYLYAKDCMVKN